MQDPVLEDAVYTSRWKSAFIWNFCLLGLLTPCLVIIGYHFSQQNNPITSTKGKAYKAGAIASLIAVIVTYLMLSVAAPLLTGMSVGELARSGKDQLGRSYNAASEWVASWSNAPKNTTAVEQTHREVEALSAEASERQRVLAERQAAEERAAHELEQKRRQTPVAPAAIPATREKTFEDNEETRELARFAEEQRKKESKQEQWASAQDAKRAAQTATEKREEAENAVRKTKAFLRIAETDVVSAQERVKALDKQDQRPANYAQLRKLYQEAEVSAKRRVTEARASAKTAEREVSRAQSDEIAARARAEAFGNVEAPTQTKPAKPVIGLYRLKDGRDISAVKVLDFGDSYGLMDESGRVITVLRTEVWDIQDP